MTVKASLLSTRIDKNERKGKERKEKKRKRKRKKKNTIGTLRSLSVDQEGVINM